MELRYSKRTRSDIRQLTAYFKRYFGADFAVAQHEQIVARCERLCDFPWTGHHRDDLFPGLRTVTVKKTVILYRVFDDIVEIVRIVDGRRNLKMLFRPR